MSSLCILRAYWWKEGDTVVVQNWVGGFKGQEHRHTEAEFLTWKEDAQEGGVEVVEAVTEKGGGS